MPSPSIKPESTERLLPPAFIRDCDECGCDIGEIVRTDYRGTLLRSTPAQYAELLSRAQHYAEDGTDAAPRGIGSAAKALLRAAARMGAA